MTTNGDQIHGWKSIGAHFRRDRSTAIRWANERGLPVHRLPGGKSASVYALRAELDEWARSNEPAADTTEVAPKTATRRWRLTSPLALILGGTAIVAATATAGRLIQNRLPADSELAELYLEARDDWARADAAGLARAIAKFEAIVARDPGFARAHAGLADAYLLSGEYGSLSYDVAYGRAKRSAERALALDPNLAIAHRDLGYIAYWWERDPVEAGVRFRKAIELEPNDWMAHFWYASVLADNGEFAAGKREFLKARLGRPGSLAIETHLSLAQWRAGETAAGIAGLEKIAARELGDALSRYFLAVAYAGEGDFVRYLRIMQERDALRGEPVQSANLKALDDALRAGGDAALKAAVIDQASVEEANRPFPDHSLPAFLASAAGDRVRLVTILQRADRNKELWGAAGYTSRIAARWKSDGEVMRLLARRASPKVEPGR